MLDTLRAWLNSSRNYFTGVVLYSEVGGDKKLLEVLKKGPNDFRVRRLHEELLTICNQLKKENHVTGTNQMGTAKEGNANESIKNGDQQKTDVLPCNPALYELCKREADHAYKKVMNDRAVLFSLAKESGEDYTDPNMPDKVQAREKLAIDVVIGFQKASELYDRAAYVKEFGRLPNTDDQADSEYDSIPDSLVKQQLDNARKAFNKLKAKEPTPARIELMQRHQINIKKLEEKWRSLKQA